MRGLVLVLLIVVIVPSLSFLVLSINNDKIEDKNTEIEEKSKILEFSTFTSAVCENREEVVHCKDEFFVNCNGEISKAVDVAECNGIKVDVPKALGFAVFGKEWKDPRG